MYEGNLRYFKPLLLPFLFIVKKTVHLECWMKQAMRVELFKKNQCAAHALHVKFHLISGNQVFTDGEYNHLQIDVISVYLLFLVQMISSGLQIIYTQVCYRLHFAHCKR